MADEDIVLRYRADVTQLRTDINNIIALNEKLAQSVKDASIASKQSANDQKQAASVSKKSIETQINQQNRLKKSIEDTGKAAGKSATQFKKVTTEVNKTGKEVSNLNKQSGVFSNTVKRIGAGIAIAFSVQRITQFLKESVKVTAEFDSLGRSLAFIEGSVEGGAATFEFITQLAEEFGLELRSTTEAYRQFSGASRLAGLSTLETQEIFRNTSKAITALGLGAQQADRIFLALSQIVSKGVVSAEELRRQLGDALPGAFSIAAQSVGKTEAEFNKLLSTGQILSKDFLPNFSRLLGETFEEGAIEGAQSLNAELNRLENQITELSLKIGEDFAPAWLKFKKFGLEALNAIRLATKETGQSLALLLQGDIPGLLALLADIEQAEVDPLAKETAVVIQNVNDEEEKLKNARLKRLKEQEDAIKREFDAVEANVENTRKYNEEIERIEKERTAVQQENSQRRILSIENEAKEVQEIRDKAIEDAIASELVGLNEAAKQKVIVSAVSDPESFSNIISDEAQKDIDRYNTQLKILDELIQQVQQTIDNTNALGDDGIAKATRELIDYEDLLKKSLLEVARIRDEESRVFRETADEDVKKAAKANLDTAERAFKTLEKLYDDARERRQEAIDDFRKGTEDLTVTFTRQIQQALEQGVDADDIFGKLANQLVDNLESARRLIDSQVPAQIQTRIEQEIPTEGETGPLPFDFERAKEIEAEVTEDAAKRKIIAEQEYEKELKVLIDLLKQLGIITEESNDQQLESWLSKNQEILQATADLYFQISQLAGAFTDRRIQELDRELRAVRDAANEEEETLRQQRENRLITEEFFQNELARIKEKEKETEEKVNKEKNRLARKQAILDKSAAIYDITLNTAVAISENLGKPFLIALIAALGAAQIATVVATPIPQFARGTKGKKDSGMAIVGEEGPEMTFLDRGTKVLPAKQTKQYSNVFDAMYDNKFDDYVLKEYVSPALEAQKKQYESQRQETFAQNIVNSMTGLTYYDLEASRKKGQYINNIDEFAKAVAKASEINYRRL